MNDVMDELLSWLRNPCAETASDVVVLAMKEIRRLRDDPNRSQCELGALFAKSGRLMKEVERLRMTDAEREMLTHVRDICAAREDNWLASAIDALLARVTKEGTA